METLPKLTPTQALLLRVAAIMTLLATAKANGHDPHAWLSDVPTRLPLDRDLDALLPHRWQRAG